MSRQFFHVVMAFSSVKVDFEVEYISSNGVEAAEEMERIKASGMQACVVQWSLNDLKHELLKERLGLLNEALLKLEMRGYERQQA